MDRSKIKGLRQINLIGKKILVAKAEKTDILDADGGILLYFTPHRKEDCQWGMIVNVSDECELYSKAMIGWFIHAPFTGDGFYALGSEWGGAADIWIIGEKMVEETHSELKGFVHRAEEH